jgi:hypothetical protein
LLLLTGCQQYYLSVAQQWVDAQYLASSSVATPDPRQEDPPVGQMLVVNWRVPDEIFLQKPHIELDLILWDYSTRHVTIPLKHRMDYTSWRLVDEEYHRTGGILTYKARLITEEGEVFREWKHQLWTELIVIEE